MIRNGNGCRHYGEHELEIERQLPNEIESSPQRPSLISSTRRARCHFPWKQSKRPLAYIALLQPRGESQEETIQRARAHFICEPCCVCLDVRAHNNTMSRQHARHDSRRLEVCAVKSVHAHLHPFCSSSERKISSI
jgi:hypothetical protein